MPAIPLSLPKAEPAQPEVADRWQQRPVADQRGWVAFPLGLLCRAVSSVGGGFIVGSYFGLLAGVGGAALGVSLLLLNERQSRPSA